MNKNTECILRIICLRSHLDLKRQTDAKSLLIIMGLAASLHDSTDQGFDTSHRSETTGSYRNHKRQVALALQLDRGGTARLHARHADA